MSRPPKADDVKAICKLFRSIHTHNPYPLFGDCVESIAIAISNAVDLRHREEREARYMAHVERYGSDIMSDFAKVLAHITTALEAEPADVLGQVFHELELHNDARGQFFTPYDLCRMMAEMLIGDDTPKQIQERGFITAQEPACGSGAMVIALAEAMEKRGLNYQQHLHVTAIDVDARAAHMAYVQFSLLHIPAVIYVGNSLSLEIHEAWYTPAHILGGWSYRLQKQAVSPEASERVEPVVIPQPPTSVESVGQLGLDLGI